MAHCLTGRYLPYVRGSKRRQSPGLQREQNEVKTDDNRDFNYIRTAYRFNYM